MKLTFVTPIIMSMFLALVATKSVAKTLEVAVGWTKPPYVVSADDSGFEIELVKDLLSQMGHADVHILYVPYGRSVKMIQDGSVDMGLTLSPAHGTSELLLSNPYVAYQNAVIALSKHNFSIESVSDLDNYSVVAFQNANVVLGNGFKNAVNQAALYIELPEQRRQVEMLLLGNMQVAVMDRFIFMHLSREITGKEQLGNVDVFQLFPINYYRAGFKDPELLQQFNLELEKSLLDGRYRKLAEKYELSDMAALVERRVAN